MSQTFRTSTPLLVLACCAALFVPRVASAGGGGACQFDVPCSSDSDCGAGTRCYPGSATVCPSSPDGGSSTDGGTASDGGSACSSIGLCEIPYNRSCLADSDCGDGFTCALDGQQCDCSSMPTGVPPTAVSTPCSEVTPPGLPPGAPAICAPGSSCLCWKVGSCNKQATAACTSDATCPSGWSCTSGTCEPPCWGDGVTSLPAGGAASGGSPPSGGFVPSGKNEVAGNPTAGCSVVASDAANGGSWLALVAGALALGAARRRRQR